MISARALPIAGGGIDGAEGCKVFLLEGSDENATAAYELVKVLKGEPKLKTKLIKKPDTLT